ncbi:hypothetical protein EMCG_03999 [[Emmonsia] crescens]|uniref:Uncharacterized protein n=1 Tax=[Emmonsia] crescens TaxID=73230 RepID=A0A0G2HTN4_9EURO|nr:hypothetical protein EMCG_03999 [Emmonsia crescens UAMH 3008]
MDSLDAEDGDENDQKGGGLLVHMFSNGSKCLLLDSSPGKSRKSTSLKALSYSLARSAITQALGKLAIFITICIFNICGFLIRATMPIERGRAAVTGTGKYAALLPGGMRGCSVYSERDDVVLYADVEEAAEQVRGSKGMVRMEKFEGMCMWAI